MGLPRNLRCAAQHASRNDIALATAAAAAKAAATSTSVHSAIEILALLVKHAIGEPDGASTKRLQAGLRIQYASSSKKAVGGTKQRGERQTKLHIDA
jgi:hypothetical protein